MKKLQLIASIFCLSVLLSSCARNYHLELVGHYKPNTDVAKKSAAIPSEKAVQSISQQNENESEASATESQPDLTLVQLPPQQASSPKLTEKQQQKFDKKLEKVKTKVEKQVSQNGQQIQQHEQSNYNSGKKTSLSTGDQLLCAIISIFIPPLGVILYEEDITVHFWIDLLLTILFYLPGLIYALIIILGGVHHD